MIGTLRRIALLTTAGALGLFGLPLMAPSLMATSLIATASAATAVSIVGSAPSVVTGAPNVTYFYSVALPGDVTAASFTTHQDPRLAASASGVILDNVAVPSGQITTVGASDISVAAGPAGLSAGTHLLAFQATVPAAVSAVTSASISFSYSDPTGAHTLDSAAVVIVLNPPDLAVALTPDSGEQAGVPGPLGTGRIAGLAVDVTNLGQGAPQTALLITLPTGVGLAVAGVSKDSAADSAPLLPCAALASDPQQVRCAIGAIPHTLANDDPTFNIPLISIANPPVGQTAGITVAVAPADASQGVDTNLANNSVRYSVIFTGKAHLSYQLVPAASKIVLGQTTTVKVTVHNAGPDVAGAAIGVVATENSRFTITGFTGKKLALGSSGTGLNPNPAVGNARAIRNALPTLAARTGFGNIVVGAGMLSKDALIKDAAAPSDTGDGVIWLVGDIAVGASVSATLTLRAKALGSMKVEAVVFSNAADPACPNLNCRPPTISLQAVPAPIPVATPVPKTPAVPPVSTGQSDGGTVLANTGAVPLRSLDLGLILMLLGSGLLWAGRRRHS